MAQLDMPRNGVASEQSPVPSSGPSLQLKEASYEAALRGTGCACARSLDNSDGREGVSFEQSLVRKKQRCHSRSI